MHASVNPSLNRNELTFPSNRRGATPAPQSADPRFLAFRRVPLFACVPNEVLASFAAQARWQVYAAGEIVVDAGDPSADVFVITEGAVRVVVRTAFGYEAIFNDLVAGDFFGEMAAIDGAHRSANVTALSYTRLCVIHGTAFMDLVLSSREVSHRLLSLLSARLRNKDERLIEFGALTVRQRLIAELLRLSRSRGGGERVVSPPPPQHVLAARVGTRRESVSREMAEMARSGLITTGRSAVVLHNPDKLKAEIEARLHGGPDATDRHKPR
jgi:CRP/FNR family cyclic AMP-dependent transcriptional regulator